MSKAIITAVSLALLCQAGAAAPARAQVISIEAESYADSLDIGGVPIGVEEDPGCSGGSIVVGLDLAGEWIAFEMPVETLGVYAPRLWCRGTLGQEYRFTLTLTPDTLGGQQSVGFSYTGAGYG